MLLSMIENGKKSKLPQKIDYPKQIFKSLKLESCLLKIISNPNICEKNGSGNNMTIQ